MSVDANHLSDNLLPSFPFLNFLMIAFDGKNWERFDEIIVHVDKSMMKIKNSILINPFALCQPEIEYYIVLKATDIKKGFSWLCFKLKTWFDAYEFHTSLYVDCEKSNFRPAFENIVISWKA